MSAPGSYPPAQYPPGDSATAPLLYLEGAPASFGEAVTQAFRNGFVYRGRASRSAFWWFGLFQGIVIIALEVISLAASTGGNRGGGAAGTIAGLIFILVMIYLTLVGLALLVRRLHDTDTSGWWMLISFVPFVGPIALLVFTLLRGTPGPNRYRP